MAVCGHRTVSFLTLKSFAEADKGCFKSDSILNKENVLNKLELIQALKEKARLTKQEASEVVDLFFFEMTNAFIKGERVEIRGLCSFFVKEYEPYTGRNPKTGKKVLVPAKKAPFFKCGKELKERVDYPAN